MKKIEIWVSGILEKERNFLTFNKPENGLIVQCFPCRIDLEGGGRGFWTQNDWHQKHY